MVTSLFKGQIRLQSNLRAMVFDVLAWAANCSFIYYLSRDSPPFKRDTDINTNLCIRYAMKTQDEMVSECILHWPEGFSVTCGMWQFMWYPLSQPSQNSIKSWQAAKDAVVNDKLLWWVFDRWFLTLRLKDPVDHHRHTRNTHTHTIHTHTHTHPHTHTHTHTHHTHTQQLKNTHELTTTWTKNRRFWSTVGH